MWISIRTYPNLPREKVNRYISWGAFIAWIGVWLLSSFIIIDEELGITHILGLNPITWDALHSWKLFITILLAGPTFSLWWGVHIYRRKYGDLSKRK